MLLRLTSGCGLLVALLAATAGGRAMANHETAAGQAAAYIPKDLPQQFGWQHGVQLSGEVGGQGRGEEVQVAGEWGDLRDLTLQFDTAVSYQHDEVLLGTAVDLNNSIFLTGTLDADWLVGMGLTLNSHVVDGKVNLEQTSFAYDVFAQYAVTEHLSLGGFVSFIYSDINNTDFTLDGSSGTIQGDAYRYGAGLLATWQQQWRAYTFTFTTSVASMNSPDVKSVFDTNYASWNNLLSIYRPITDKLGVEGYASWVHLLDSPASNRRDREFGTLGVSLDYRLNDAWSISAGYERTICYSNFESNTVNLGATWVF